MVKPVKGWVQAGAELSHFRVRYAITARYPCITSSDPYTDRKNCPPQGGISQDKIQKKTVAMLIVMVLGSMRHHAYFT